VSAGRCSLKKIKFRQQFSSFEPLVAGVELGDPDIVERMMNLPFASQRA
jgi:hypothetical protein